MTGSMPSPISLKKGSLFSKRTLTEKSERVGSLMPDSWALMLSIRNLEEVHMN